jgi:hypothetical protein
MEHRRCRDHQHPEADDGGRNPAVAMVELD